MSTLAAVEHPQGIDAGVVTIAPDDVVGITPDRGEIGDAYIWKLGGLQIETLRWMVPLAHCTRAGRPQGVESVAALGAIIPIDQKNGLLLNQFE